MADCTTLNDVFASLKNPENFKIAIKTRVIKIILGSSVIRVFSTGSKPYLIKCLESIDVGQLVNIKSQSGYDNWHRMNVDKIYKCLRCLKENEIKLSANGLMWGHSTKIFNLFIGHLVIMSPYFTDHKNIHTIKYFLHVPLDSKAFEVLKMCEVENVPNLIKDIDEKTYHRIQLLLRKAALNHNIPALYFDEYAWSTERD